jgi:hypothetical protein
VSARRGKWFIGVWAVFLGSYPDLNTPKVANEPFETLENAERDERASY